RGRTRRELGVMRRFALGLLFASALVAWPGPAGAQPTPAASPTGGPVSMSLLFQSAWNSPTRPLAVKVMVTNDGDQPLTAVTLTLSIGFPARSRTVFEESLTSDPTGSLFTQPFFEAGSIRPGQS